MAHCATLVCVVAASAGTPEDFCGKYFPTGVRIAISSEQLKSLRPQAIEIAPIDASGWVAHGVTMMLEPPDRRGDLAAYWWRFKDKKLAAITKSTLPPRAESDNRMRLAVQEIINDLSASFQKITEEKILRSSGGHNILLTAQLWENADAGRSVYLVASNEETTIIMFDPKIFGSRNFFVSSDRLKDIEAMTETSGIPKSLSPPVDLLSKLAANPSILSGTESRSGTNSQVPRKRLSWEKVFLVTGLSVLIGGLVVWFRKTRKTSHRG